MKKVYCISIVMLLSLLMSSLLQAKPYEKPKLLFVDSGSADQMGSQRVFTKDDDIRYIYGGPDTLEGQFQTESGEPDRQGWISHDFHLPEIQPDSFIIDDFYCGNLDPMNTDNHAYWCGDYHSSCTPGGEPGGYNDYIDTGLEWELSMSDTSAFIEGILDFSLNYDLENNYDFLYIERYSAYSDEWFWLMEYTGTGYGLHESVPFFFNPPDYDNGKARLRFRVITNYENSSIDCGQGNIGACQIDNIQVSFIDGSATIPQGPVETCEPGDPQNWQAVDYYSPNGTGDFGKVWNQLDEFDSQYVNQSPRWAFIDDGIVVPELPGYTNGFDYGPNGYCVNATGGLLGPDHGLDNRAISPPIAIPDGDWSEVYFEYEEYTHQEVQWKSFPTFSRWLVRSTSDPTGNSGWSDWDYNHLAFFGGPQVNKRQIDITPYLVERPAYIQVSFGVYQLSGFLNPYSSPAPYFDNAAVFLTPELLAGPVLAAEPEFTLGQDNTLKWSDESATGAISYLIECAKDEGFADLVTDSGWIPQTTYVFNNLPDGNTHYFRVKFRTGSYEESEWSTTEYSTQDATLPVSSADPLPPIMGSYAFEIPYVATDDNSGISTVELFFSRNGVNYTHFGSFTQSPIDFVATRSGKYFFYTVSSDVAGNFENAPFEADAMTKIQEFGVILDHEAEFNNKDKSMVRVFALHSNIPNPFNPMTTISFSLPEDQHVLLGIYGLDGKEVCSLVNEMRGPGSHEVIWAGRDNSGLTVASGIYFCRLEAGNFKKVMKMTLMK